MHVIRSVLWIRPASALAESGALDCPSLDVTWVPDVRDALALACDHDSQCDRASDVICAVSGLCEDGSSGVACAQAGDCAVGLKCSANVCTAP